MKTKTILFSILTGLFTLVATQTFSQDTLTNQEQKRERQAVKEKDKNDKQRLDAAVDLKRDTRSNAKIAKANAKEANRIEDDASDAAKQAKQAARTEAKAQRTRDNANKQAKQAAKASQKSNNN